MHHKKSNQTPKSTNNSYNWIAGRNLAIKSCFQEARLERYKKTRKFNNPNSYLK